MMDELNLAQEPDRQLNPPQDLQGMNGSGLATPVVTPPVATAGDTQGLDTNNFPVQQQMPNLTQGNALNDSLHVGGPIPANENVSPEPPINAPMEQQTDLTNTQGSSAGVPMQEAAPQTQDSTSPYPAVALQADPLRDVQASTEPVAFESPIDAGVEKAKMSNTLRLLRNIGIAVAIIIVILTILSFFGISITFEKV